MTRKTPLVVAMLLFSISFTGCSENTKNEDLATLSGTVTYNGKAIADAKVELVRTKKGADSTGAGDGLTDSSGQYVIANVPLGTYKVVVTKLKFPKGIVGADEALDQGQLEAATGGNETLGGGAQGVQNVTNELPPKYASSQSTNFSIALKKGDNTLDLKLTD